MQISSNRGPHDTQATPGHHAYHVEYNTEEQKGH